MNSNSINNRQQNPYKRNKALEGTVRRIWSSKLDQDSVDRALKAVVGELSDELTHLRTEDREAIHFALSQDDWFCSLVTWGKKVSPTEYTGRTLAPKEYLSASVISSLLKKYERTIAGLNPRQVAMTRFVEAERLCKLTNKRLRHYRRHPVRPLTKRVDVNSVFHAARQKICKWLGPSPSLDELADLARHGPGGNLSTGRPFVTPYYKFGNDGKAYKVGRGAHALARAAITTSDSWLRAICCEADGIPLSEAHNVSFPQHLNWDRVDARLELADYNKVTFVPKTCFTFRSIAIEPDMNIYLQLGVGAMIRRCLKEAGCNLDSQERNQVLAWLGSVERSWYDPVTVDMSMASDTVAFELVKELLPPDWFNLLNRLRSSQGMVDGKTVCWEKFSSMGNGYTFELESLIFYALAQAVQDGLGVTEFFRENGQHAYEYLGVYGDDIIVPKACWSHLHEILKYCGFVVNWDKSFVDGPFRESCGKDYWNGRDVRPLFLREEIKTEGDLVKARNGLDWLVKSHSDLFLDGEGFVNWVDTLVHKTLSTHLRGVGHGMHSCYLNVPVDQTHVSGLVGFNSDLQAFIHPVIIEKAQVYRGRAMWRYVQYLYSGSSRKRDQSGLTDTVIRRRSSNPLLDHISQGGSSGDVIRSGVVLPKITYRTM